MTLGGEERGKPWIRDQPWHTSEEATRNRADESRWSAGVKRMYRMLLVLLGSIKEPPLPLLRGNGGGPHGGSKPGTKGTGQAEACPARPAIAKQ